MSKLFIIALIFTGFSALAADDQTSDHPSWFSKDYRSKTEWGFYCEGQGKTEAEALQSAHSQCSQKICLLFGVEVDSQVKTQETLKDTSVTSTVVERCPNVRVVGRIEKKKSVECEDKACNAFVLELYPKTEYDLEYKRLNQPAISKVLEQTIVVREGNDTFQDPKACYLVLDTYAAVLGETDAASKDRIAALESAAKPCANLDYRDTRIQSELMKREIKSMDSRDMGTKVLLSQKISNSTSADARIQSLLEFERTKLASGKKVDALKKLLAKKFDSFHPHWKRDPTNKFLVLFDGALAEKDPYIEETQTCAQGTELIQKWPRELTQDINICSVADPTVCQNFNVMYLRAQWYGCLCHKQAEGLESPCVSTLMPAIDANCTDVITQDCFKKAQPNVKEKIGKALNWPK